MAITRLGSISFAAGERNLDGPAIQVDNTNNYVYIGHRPPGGSATNIRLSRITHPAFVRDLTSANANDSGGTGSGAYALVLDETNSRAIMECGNFTWSISLAAGIAFQNIYTQAAATSSKSLAVDSTVSKFYTALKVGTNLTLLELNYTPTVLRSISLALYSQPGNLVYDTVRGFIYVSQAEAAGNIYKIRVSDFTLISTITPVASSILHNCIDLLNGFAYFIYTSGIVGKLNLNTGAFSTLAGFGAGTNAMTISPLAGYMYLSREATPSVIYEVNLSTFTITSTLALNSGENSAKGLSIHKNSGMIYVGLGLDPTQIIQLQGEPEPPTSTPRVGGPNIKRKPGFFDAQSMMARMNNTGGY